MTTVFVFGSNLYGVHGAGAALDARNFHGAIDGLGCGFAGQSYALPTCSRPGRPLPLDVIKRYVVQFTLFADIVKAANYASQFNVTRLGCGLAGYKDHEIAPMFAACDPSMCAFDASWERWLGNRYRYWIKT